MAISITDITIREFQPTEQEYETLAGISNAVYPEYEESAEEWRYFDDNFDRTKYAHKRYVVEEPQTGKIVAWGEYRHRTLYFHPDRYRVQVEVLPEYRGRGIGSRVFDLLVEDLNARNAEVMQTDTHEHWAHSLAFLAHRGFYEISREWESRINPQEFDPAPYQKYLDRLAEEGIEIVTLAQMKETDPEWLQRVYDLHMAAERDVPSPNEYTPTDIEHFRTHEIDAPESLPDAFFIAKDGDLYVGESYLGRSLTGETPLWQGLTGVRREYRGRGIAIALKVKAMLWARQQDYSMLKTWNSTLNEGMLAINGRLGFVRQPAWIDFEKKLR